MTESADRDSKSGTPAQHRMRIPVFITEESVGLGDVIKRTIARFGIPPCAGCSRRAEVFNRWIEFSGRRQY